MAANSKIEWTEATWNPIVGCSIVSPGCTNCYAMKMAARCEAMGISRYGTLTKKVNGNTVWAGKLARAPQATLLAPLRRKEPTTYFVNSMGDLFHEGCPDEWIDQVFAVMALCRQHTFQVLTKRSDRMRRYLSDPLQHNRMELAAEALQPSKGRPFSPKHVLPRILPNVWLGVSAERQNEANERIPDLLATPAAVRFVSVEPLLGPIDLRRIIRESHNGAFMDSALDGFVSNGHGGRYGAKLDWVIVGGESGRDARPMHPDWARSLRDQCAASDVAFFFKQWGEWKNGSDFAIGPSVKAVLTDGRVLDPSIRSIESADRETRVPPCHPTLMRKVGKKRAGRLLDDIEHNGMPRSIGSQQ